MTGFYPLLVKEFKEQIRTFKLLAIFLVLLLLGVGGMVALAFLPDLLRLTGEDAGIQLPQVTASGALASYDSSVVQIGLLTMVLIAMGSVARERERKTALIILSKPVSVAAYVGAKLVAYSGSVILTVVVLGLVAWAYAVAFFEGNVALGGLFAMIGTQALFLTFVVAVTIGASCLFRNMLPAAVVAFATLMGLAISSALPVIGQHLPGAVTGWGLAIMAGQDPDPRWSAVAVTILTGAASVFFGWWRLSRTEV
jgi:ABC-2 type transport system permease protein